MKVTKFAADSHKTFAAGVALERLVIRREADQFSARQETGRLQATSRMAGGTIQTADQSLWANVLLTMGCRTD